MKLLKHENRAFYLFVLLASLIILLTGSSSVIYFSSLSSPRAKAEIIGIYADIEMNITANVNYYFSTDAEIAKSINNSSIIIVSFRTRGILNVTVLEFCLAIEYSYQTEKQFSSAETTILIFEDFISLIGYFPGIPELPIDSVDLSELGVSL